MLNNPTEGIPTYPDYEILVQILGYQFCINIGTMVRLQRESDGKWFLTPVTETSQSMTELNGEDREIIMKRFHEKVYKHLLFYRLHEKEGLKDYRGLVVDIEDEIQVSEEERLNIKL